MTPYIPEPQITVLDAGGQYCHLIARKVRELGVYADVRASETPAADLLGRKGVIISGGPSSVYDVGSPTVDPGIFSQASAVLGICYGQQLMAHLLGGSVEKGTKGEYGLAFLDFTARDPLFEGVSGRQQVWMSHRDLVRAVPAGFRVLGSTETCSIAAISDVSRRLYGVQFHPEVIHTPRGMDILTNFLFGICGCTRDWNPKHRIPLIEERIRETAGDRSVFFFVSGGVDSTVAFTLCLRALGPHRARGIYVDTGFMREGETEFVRQVFNRFEQGAVEIVRAQDRFVTPLATVRDPEQKRRLIGEEFVRIQEEIIASHHFLDEQWILGQGTIYPDTIESGGTAKASLIKTHHNRVPGIVRLMEANRIVEPLSLFYKDEVREIGHELGLPPELLERHPFPGPGLAIRCLCSAKEAPVEQSPEGWFVPVRSVGVQGDERSYRYVLALDERPTPESNLQAEATERINRVSGINRIVARVDSNAPLNAMRVFESALVPERLDRLRRADAIVRSLSHSSGFDKKVWQFPVILLPVGVPGAPDSVVLRPVHSVDGMTAQSVNMEAPVLQSMAAELLRVDGVCGVFYDLTHKPPGTIEWE